jgi:hypothetical protein
MYARNEIHPLSLLKKNFQSSAAPNRDCFLPPRLPPLLPPPRPLLGPEVVARVGERSLTGHSTAPLSEKAQTNIAGYITSFPMTELATIETCIR